MDKLPNGWKSCKMIDIMDVRDGTHDSPKYHETGYPLVTSKNLKPWGLDLNSVSLISEEDYNLINKRSKVDKGDILFAMIGTIGNPTLVKEEPNFAIKNMALFKPKSDLNINFVCYYLSSPDVIQKMIDEANGATQKFVGLNYLRNFPIIVPPLPEQTRIVNKLDSLFERIDKSIALLEENIKHTEALMASVLDEVFEQAENNKKFEIKLLKDAVRVINGRAYKQQELLNEGKYPVIRVGNFFSNRSWYYSDLELDEDKYCDNGDLLYAWSASFGPKIWDGDRSIFHYHIWKMEIISPNLLKDYLYYMLLRDTEKIKSEGGRGVGMIHITKGDIEVRKITLPPLVNQNQIVDKIKVLNQNLEKLLTEQQSKLNYLKALKASLLDKAFKGEL